MKNLQAIKMTIKKNKTLLREKFSVKRIGLFGSYIRGEQKRTSDLDILVEFQKPIGFFIFLDLEEYLSKILKVKIDLVSKKALKPHIGQHILKEIEFV